MRDGHYATDTSTSADSKQQAGHRGVVAPRTRTAPRRWGWLGHATRGCWVLPPGWQAPPGASERPMPCHRSSSATFKVAGHSPEPEPAEARKKPLGTKTSHRRPPEAGERSNGSLRQPWRPACSNLPPQATPRAARRATPGAAASWRSWVGGLALPRQQGRTARWPVRAVRCTTQGTTTFRGGRCRPALWRQGRRACCYSARYTPPLPMIALRRRQSGGACGCGPQRGVRVKTQQVRDTVIATDSMASPVSVMPS